MDYEVKTGKYFTNQEGEEPVHENYFMKEQNIKLMQHLKKEIVSKEAKMAFEKLEQLLEQSQSSQNGEESA
jgi:uncharacterized protein YbcV (DUF1398 family)